MRSLPLCEVRVLHPAQYDLTRYHHGDRKKKDKQTVPLLPSSRSDWHVLQGGGGGGAAILIPMSMRAEKSLNLCYLFAVHAFNSISREFRSACFVLFAFTFRWGGGGATRQH